MYTVSTAFKSAVYAQTRETKAKVEFELIDVDAYDDASVTVTGEASFSKKDQVINLIRDMSGKYATFENDYWLLDGSFVLPPKASESGYEVGWWSAALCDANGDFSVSQVCTIDFTVDHSSIGITITFDQQTNEYAEDFEIDVYDSSAVLLHNETVTGNTLAKYILEENLTDFRQIVITITKWATGNRRARITEVDFGIIQEYTDTEIIKLDILEELDTLSNQVTANEIKLTLDNQSKDFNILNPTGIYPYLQRTQKLIPYLGVVITDTLTEYVPMGVYYLTEWVSDEGTLTATFTARDVLDLLEQNTFSETTYTSKTITYILEDILDDAGITDYVIDSNLGSITVTGTIPEGTHRAAIQIAAIAGMGVVYSDRNGVLQIKQLTTPASIDTIDYDNVYAAPKIELDKLINTVYVKYGSNTYTLVDPSKPSDEQTLAVTVDNPLIDTLGVAEDVADWVLAEFKKRFLYEINWRQNSAFELGDIVTVEDDFSEDKTMRITRNEFNYIGYLSGKTKGKGDGT
jgi:hypothetical protein